MGFSGWEESSSLDLEPPFSDVKKGIFVSSFSFVLPPLASYDMLGLQIVQV